MRLFSVLDTDAETLATETVRTAGGAPAVEFVDLRMASDAPPRRLGAVAVYREAQELYRSPALPRNSGAQARRSTRRQAIPEADRALRMAKTLADGGFPEEAPALLAKALRAMAAALIAARGETPAGADNDIGGDIRRLVDCGALPTETMSVQEALQSLSSTATAEDVAPLLSSATRILMVIGRNEPSLAAIRAPEAPKGQIAPPKEVRDKGGAGSIQRPSWRQEEARPARREAPRITTRLSKSAAVPVSTPRREKW